MEIGHWALVTNDNRQQSTANSQLISIPVALLMTSEETAVPFPYRD